MIYKSTIYKYDFICLSEAYLDSPIPNNLIDIEGYKLIRADPPDNIKRGGVFLCSSYYSTLFKRSPAFENE